MELRLPFAWNEVVKLEGRGGTGKSVRQVGEIEFDAPEVKLEDAPFVVIWNKLSADGQIEKCMCRYWNGGYYVPATVEGSGRLRTRAITDRQPDREERKRAYKDIAGLTVRRHDERLSKVLQSAIRDGIARDQTVGFRGAKTERTEFEIEWEWARRVADTLIVMDASVWRKVHEPKLLLTARKVAGRSRSKTRYDIAVSVGPSGYASRPDIRYANTVGSPAESLFLPLDAFEEAKSMLLEQARGQDEHPDLRFPSTTLINSDHGILFDHAFNNIERAVAQAVDIYSADLGTQSREAAQAWMELRSSLALGGYDTIMHAYHTVLPRFMRETVDDARLESLRRSADWSDRVLALTAQPEAQPVFAP
jgi:hypothetical protein